MGARRKAICFFEKSLRRVIELPSDKVRWQNLLEFPGCLVQPERGGKCKNFTKLIVKQIESSSAPTSLSKDLKHKRLPKVSQLSADELAAKRASTKLEAGDVRGAVRLLCSDESMAPLCESTRQSLFSKHPQAPTDKRSAPFLSSAPL